MSSSQNIIKRTTSSFATLRTIYAKELRGYLAVPFGWVILGCTMALQGFILQAVLQVMTHATGNGVMYHMLDNLNFWFCFIFIFPLITMRCMAEEERQGTLEGLLTAPVTTTQIVLGKYFAAYTFYLLLWLPMLLYPLASEIGNVYTEMRYGIQPEGVITYMLADWVGPYLILALSGAFFVALGIMCSALTRSQIIAAILCTCLMIMYYFMGRATELWGEFPAAPVFHYMSCTEHVRSFSSGVIDTRPVVLYLSLTVFTLALTKRIVDYRRWTR
ncbi:MAG: ABC transporter permease [Akkermansia sp.]|jgi:ABC-2 type transport system permease protein|nr:ABC transporter permease [Akkermansia sp.]